MNESLPKVIAALCVLGSSLSLRAATDAQKERFFHQTYTRFNSTPTSAESWNSMLRRLQVNVYTVQDGDSLWEISQTLFADPNFWPKIWAMNGDKIYNPHQISPDQEILFYPGSPSLPPALGAAEGKEKPTEKISRPRRTVPVAMLPQSFPPLKFPVTIDRVQGNQDVVHVADDFFTNPEADKRVDLVAYYSDGDLSEVKDEVLDTERGYKSGGPDDILYVRVQNPSEKTYHVVNVNELSEGGPKFIRVFGQVRLVSKTKTNDQVYKAVIEKAIDLPKVGYKLLPGPIPFVEVPVVGKTSSQPARIIGGQFGANQLIPSGSFFFLDAGRASGLNVGDILPIFSNPNIRTSSAYLDMNFKKIGIAQIVKVENKGATAYLITANDDVRVGDLSGSLGKEELEDDKK